MSNEVNTQDGLIFSLRLFSEITLKSAPVRKRWVKLLTQNIRLLGRRIHPRTTVVQDWDRVEVRVPCSSAETRSAFIDLLSRTPGIANYSEVTSYPYVSFEDVFAKTLPVWSPVLVGKTFCVRVRRKGQHDFTSTELERYIGGGLRQHIDTAGVKLKNPDVTVHIEVDGDKYFVSAGKYQGLGGFPVGTQDPVLSLVSGGFDSTVASYQMMCRGMRTHFCFFNLGGRAHELGVKEIAYFLWQKYASSHRVKFISVPFDGVVEQILTHVGPSNMGVILKRMMLRAAEQVARKGKIQALVTGEAISQVSSQTIANLSAIDRVTDMLTLRPLITTGKPDIIHMARQIGAESLCESIPEYCGVISVKPSAKVNYGRLLEEEGALDMAVLDAAVEQAQVQSIDEVMCDDAAEVKPLVVDVLPEGGVVIDIRHPDECELSPYPEVPYTVMAIPFFKLNAQVEQLDSGRAYYLYCDKGVMSELHAAHLKDAGHHNIHVYRPSDHGERLK